MKTIIRIAIVLLFIGCKDAKKNETVFINENAETVIQDSDHPGKKIMETKCYACHNATTPEESRLAPPMAAVKKRYLMGVSNKEEFINEFLDWADKPTLEKSKMPGAVQRFGVMPYLPYPKEDIKQIADYLYENDIDQPEWFEEHYQKNHGRGQGMGRGLGNGNGMGRQMRMGSNQGTIDYNTLGMEYVLSTKAQLGKNLIMAIEKKGTAGAVEFCNLRAMKLTDSMAAVHGARIKRVSDKPRNPDNRANSKELGYIAAFKQMVEDGKDISPMIEEINDGVQFYYPITTNAMCLQCHGIPKEKVTTETLNTLKTLYPKDQALGYNENQVRGIWSIVFDKK